MSDIQQIAWGSFNTSDCIVHPIIRDSWRQQLPSPARTADDSDPSGRKLWVTPTGEETQPTEMFAEGKGNKKWIVEGYSHNLRQCDQS